MWTPMVVSNNTVMLTLNISDSVRHSIKLISVYGISGGEILMSVYKWSLIQTQWLVIYAENTNHIAIINK